jgi:hypothetical protein
VVSPRGATGDPGWPCMLPSPFSHTQHWLEYMGFPATLGSSRASSPHSARAEMTALPKVDTNCTALSLIPTVNGNTVRRFYYARTTVRSQGSSTAVSRSDIRLIQYLDSSAQGLVRR